VQPLGAVLREVAGDLAAAHREADEGDVLQVELQRDAERHRAVDWAVGVGVGVGLGVCDARGDHGLLSSRIREPSPRRMPLVTREHR